MFGLLKKKVKDFTNKVLGKSKSKIEKKEKEEPKSLKPSKDLKEKKERKEKPEIKESKESKIPKKPKEKVKEPIKKSKQISKPEKQKEEYEKKEEIPQEPIDQETKASKTPNLEREKKESVDKNVLTSIKGVFSKKIKLNEKELSSFLDDFELSLLEADVSIDAAKSIVNKLKNKFINTSFNKKNLMQNIKKNIKSTLKELLDIDCNIKKYISKNKKEKEPFVIMFIGPNGAGKTTTIAKLAKLFQNKNKSIILSSSDTFRAGSIQQLEKHANNLDVRIIKQDYGSDPAAVAYDAISAAKSSNTDFVLIDTAGRQETNFNLMKELHKIKRVIKPNLIIYVAESQAGQSVVSSLSKFDEEIDVDGIILTKIDTDPKGGVAISIMHDFKLPIFYIGTGQEYKDLVPFSVDYIVERIVE